MQLPYKHDDGDGNVGDPRFPMITTSLTHTCSFTHKHTQMAEKHTDCISAYMGDLSTWLYGTLPGPSLWSTQCLLHPEPDWPGDNSDLLLFLNYYQCHINSYHMNPFLN